MWVMEGIDARRLERAVARLGNSDAGTSWLASIGLGMPFARRAGIGLETEDVDGLSVVHAARGRDGRRTLARLWTDGSDRLRGAAPGRPTTLWTDRPGQGCQVVVAPDLRTLWLLEQAVGDGGCSPYVALAPSHDGGLPIEWRDPSFWSGFAAVSVMSDDPGGGGTFLATIAGAAVDATVMSPPGDGGWAASLSIGNGFDTAAWREAVENAVSISRYAGRQDDAVRSDGHAVDVHALDGRRRMMRVLRVEERSLSESTAVLAERHRSVEIVIRSDGMLLDVTTLPAPPGTPPRDRVLSLSDGTRLSAPPSPASAVRWSFEAAKRFVADPRPGDATAEADDILDAVAAELRDVTGLDENSVAVTAAFVMLSYVYQMFDGLRVPLFVGGTPTGRARLVRALARLAHGGLVRPCSRASVLAHAADEVGGAIIMDEPGSLAGPGGATEIGRFLVASSVSGTAWDHVGGSGRRPLRVFGPRAVVTQTAPSAGLGDVEVRVVLPPAVATPRPPDEDACRRLVDRLYGWAMRAAAQGPQVWHASPASAVAAVLALTDFAFRIAVAGAGDDAGDAAGDDDEANALVVVDGPEVMSAALAACASDGGEVLSITRLMMEAALRGGVGPDFSPERIGRWLVGSGHLEPGGVPVRRRLNGHISRTYRLRHGLIAADRATKDPFEFCNANPCIACRYEPVCATVVPGLGVRKGAPKK